MDSAEPATFPWRLREVEKHTAKLDEEKANKDDVKEIANEVRGLRRTLIGFVVGIAGSAILVSLTLLQVAVHHG